MRVIAIHHLNQQLTMRIKFIVLFVPTLLFLVTAGAQKIDRTDVNPAMTEFWDDEPEVITPGETYGAPPSDAIILFDGTDFSEWLSKDGGEVEWALDEGAMTVNPGKGSISTKKKFGSIQLHVEWRTPVDNDKEGQAGGNSGIFLMERHGRNSVPVSASMLHFQVSIHG
jgi:hypothetical protein